MSAPDDVAIVRAFARDEKVERVSRSITALPQPSSPIVIAVVRNERARIPEFLDYHRRLGVERFAIIDNHSEDDSRDILAAAPDVELFHVDTAFDWRRKHGWIMQVIRRLGRDRWFLLLDADEHAVFADCERHSIQHLTAALENRGMRRARGVLVDMYAKGPIDNPIHEQDARLAEAFPYFDSHGYSEHRNAEISARTGGPRQRVFGLNQPRFRPALTKYPLFRLSENDIAYNPHAIWPPLYSAKDPCLIALKHYKFDYEFHNRTKQAVLKKQYWNNSYEYKVYLNYIMKNPDATFFWHGSRVFARSSDFTDCKIISALDAPEDHIDFLEKIATVKRHARADLLRNLSQALTSHE